MCSCFVLFNTAKNHFNMREFSTHTNLQTNDNGKMIGSPLLRLFKVVETTAGDFERIWRFYSDIHWLVYFNSNVHLTCWPDTYKSYWTGYHHQTTPTNEFFNIHICLLVSGDIFNFPSYDKVYFSISNREVWTKSHNCWLSERSTQNCQNRLV